MPPSHALVLAHKRRPIDLSTHDFAVASTPFHRDSLPGKVGRQMQTRARFPEGWQAVAAHVSIIEAQEA
jgi:hypothetical protein